MDVYKDDDIPLIRRIYMCSLLLTALNDIKNESNRIDGLFDVLEQCRSYYRKDFSLDTNTDVIISNISALIERSSDESDDGKLVKANLQELIKYTECCRDIKKGLHDGNSIVMGSLNEPWFSESETMNGSMREKFNEIVSCCSRKIPYMGVLPFRLSLSGE